MKKLFLFLTTLSLFLFFSSCQKDVSVVPAPEEGEAFSVEALAEGLDIDPFSITEEMIAATKWPVEEALPEGRVDERGRIGLHTYQRQVITGDIALYSFVIRVGYGPYDKIGLYRVVKEEAPDQPIKTADALFYQHGDAKDFVGMMLPGLNSPTTPNDFGMAVYLAEHDVDVWGIDQAWNLVPDNLSNYNFMRNWGLQRQVVDLRKGIAIARLARFVTGSGHRQMILAGYSSGAATGFALLNMETQMGYNSRHVRAFIPVDLMIKTNNPGMRNVFLSEYQRTQALMDRGEYQDLVVFRQLGQLARNNPGGSSPIIPGFTNLQAALFFGAGPIFGETHTHYLAGTWENGLPTGLKYLTNEQLFDFLESAPLYEPALFINEYSALIAGDIESPFDDYLSQISVPILNWGAQGGLGYLSYYAFNQIGSRDVTHHIVQLLPTSQGLFDFAHIDLFIANNAEQVAWPAVLEWMRTH